MAKAAWLVEFRDLRSAVRDAWVDARTSHPGEDPMANLAAVLKAWDGAREMARLAAEGTGAGPDMARWTRAMDLADRVEALGDALGGEGFVYTREAASDPWPL